MADTVEFELKAGINSVDVTTQTGNERVTITGKGIKVPASDLELIAVLDAHSCVKRKSGSGGRPVPRPESHDVRPEGGGEALIEMDDRLRTGTIVEPEPAPVSPADSKSEKGGS
jgi:hypothetical protein